MNYFIYQDDQERGPYPIDELIKSVNAGYIEPSTMAREEDSDQWMEVSAVIVQAHQAEAKQLETEQLETERLEAERLEAQRREAQRLERLERRERLETERLERERLERREAERLERLERERLERRETERREATEKFESPFIVLIHNAFAGLLFFIAFICALFCFSPIKSESISGFTGLISCISGGVGLLISGYIINCISECAFRLRNIEFNTAKAAEKN